MYKKGSKSSSTRVSQSRISNSKPPNRHSFEGDTENVSRLANKMKSSTAEDDIEVDSAFGYRIVNFIANFTMLSQILAFKKCAGSVTFSESCRRGLGFKLVVTCEK